MVKKLNGYLLTKKVRHKFLVTVRPLTGAKTASEKTASQIARSITELE